ncbi:helix-turn-helix transcriptional regulator [Chromatocurvus halotolerans]|uniref:helix-turn-helix transcriptional regulator n=1 Tax=Chromatocurvus halotolerans TaxID=1132028 RepID=UPI000E3C6452|nr:LuxR family transcriptional regulator [Chromatocurvus halotolerans]
MKDRLIAALLACIVLLELLDVTADAGLGVPAWHLVQEWTLLLLSAAGFVYLVIDIRRRTRETRQLRGSLSLTHQKLELLGQRMRDARRQYGEVIQDQFEQWGLSLGEQEVALLLLKGLSLKEIASVRNTREKTARQQASSIYSKTGLEGRHAISAWFLEDFLTVDAPQPPQDEASSPE